MGLSVWQLLVIALLVFLLFGAGRLPRVMEDIAKGIKSFKKGMAEDDATPKRVEDKSDSKKE